MAEETSGLGVLSAIADGDLLMVVDTSDPTMSANGTNKRVLASVLLAYIEGGISVDNANWDGAGAALSIANGGTGATSVGTARSNLGLEIGSDVQGFSLSLADIADIAAATGDLLVFNGTNWVKLPVGTDGQVIKADSGESVGLRWQDEAAGGATELSGLSDVDSSVATPSDGDILVYRSAGGDWVLESKPAGGSNPALNDVTDVTISAVGDNDILGYNLATGEWINQTATELGFAAVATSGAYSDLTGAPTLATVATTGAYSDLTGTPTLGSLASQNSINDGDWSGTELAIANGGTGATSASGARANLGLAIGSDVQAYDADLATIAGLSSADGNFIVGSATGWTVESGAAARGSLGLGSAATNASSDFFQVTNDLSEIQDAAAARSSLQAQLEATQLSDISTITPADGVFIVGDGTNFVGESGATARTSLGLAIGTDVQAYSANLDDFSSKSAPTGDVVGSTDTQTLTNKTIAAGSNTLTGLPVAMTVQALPDDEDLTVQTGVVKFPIPFAMTLSEVIIDVDAAPTGSVATFDLNEAGSSVLSTLITVDAGETSSRTAATPPVISDSALAEGAIISLDIDGIGSTTAGTGLWLTLKGTRA